MPGQTIRYLDQLDEAGMPGWVFQSLHHGERTTPASMRRYCERTGAFRPNGRNANFKRRLELLLEHVRKSSPAREHWPRWTKQVLDRYPLREA